jgi:hypothetical protein
MLATSSLRRSQPTLSPLQVLTTSCGHVTDSRELSIQLSWFEINPMNTSEAIRRIIEDLLALTATSPLVIAGMRNPSHPDRLGLIGLSALVVLVTNFATCANSIFGIQLSSGLHWNWSRKLACLVTLALLVCVLPSGTLQKSGVLSSTFAVFRAAVQKVPCFSGFSEFGPSGRPKNHVAVTP